VNGRWRRALSTVVDFSGWRWIQDDCLTACLSYLAIAAMLTLLAVVVYIAATR